jgi:hypothetical protein
MGAFFNRITGGCLSAGQLAGGGLLAATGLFSTIRKGSIGTAQDGVRTEFDAWTGKIATPR